MKNKLPDLKFGHLYKVDVSDPNLIDHVLVFWFVFERENDYDVPNKGYLLTGDVVVLLERFRFRNAMTWCLSRHGVGVVDPRFLEEM